MPSALSVKTLTGINSKFSGTYNLSITVPPGFFKEARRKRSADDQPPIPRTSTFAPRIHPPASSYDNPEQTTPPPPQPPPSNGAPAYDTPAPSNNNSGPPAPDYESYGPPAPPYGPPALPYYDERLEKGILWSRILAHFEGSGF